MLSKVGREEMLKFKKLYMFSLPLQNEGSGGTNLFIFFTNFENILFP